MAHWRTRSSGCSDVLPSRSRLQSWNPDSLLTTAAKLRHGGGAIYHGVLALDDRIDRMPETRGWSGAAHDAAADMFRRAATRASTLKNYADAFAGALEAGSASIGSARAAALARADEIDSGPLNVTDQWVVMIDPAEMSADKAAELQKQAQAAQAELNELIIAVDSADEKTMQQLMLARIEHGKPFAELAYGPPGPVPPVPGDDVPNPKTPEGQQFQEAALAQDMATTIRDVEESVDEDGNRITTITMLDGSTQVTTEYIDQGLPSEQVYTAGTVKLVHTDKNGDFVSETMTTPREDGGSLTEVWYANGTKLTMSETADGVRTGSCWAPGREETILPDSFFNDPVPTLAGGALSGLETAAGKGIPKLSADVLEGLKGGGKFGGPAVGIAAMAYNIISAESLHEKCVAAWSGGVGLAGGVATTIAVGAVPGVGPIAAMGVSTGSGFLFGYVGEMVGNVLCPS